MKSYFSVRLPAGLPKPPAHGQRSPVFFFSLLPGAKRPLKNSLGAHGHTFGSF